MNKKLKNLFKIGLLTFGLILFFTNCEKERDIIDESALEEHTPPVLSKKVNFQNSEHFSQLNSRVTSLQNKFNKTKTSKGEQTDTDGLKILLDEVLYTTYAGTHTYTLKAKSQNPTYLIENIVLHYNLSTESYDEYLVQYNVNEEEYNAINNGELFQESDKVIFTKLENGFFESNSTANNKVSATSKGSSSICTSTTTTIYVSCSQNLHTQSNYELWHECRAATKPYTYQATYRYCIEISETPEETALPTPTGGGGGNDPNEIVYNPLPLQPCVKGLENDLDDSGNCITIMDVAVSEIANCIGDLTANQISFLRSDERTYQIQSFLNRNLCGQETKAFAKSVIVDMMLNKKVDLEESFASPFNIDLELVKPTILNPEPEKIKFMCIYNKLIKSPKFKKLFVDTFGESEDMHVQFKIVDNIPPIPPSTTEPNGITKTRALSVNPSTDVIVKYNAVIEINKSNMGVSSISLAKTILHESIHAYLTVKQYGCNQGTPLEDYDNVELSKLLNVYFSTACSGQSDHEFMFDSLLPTMSNILADIKDDLIPLSHQQSAEEEMFIDENNPTGPKVPWDWNQFFKYLSMAGLQNSDAFQFEMLPKTSPKYQNYEHCLRTGITEGFSKECLE